MVSYTVSPRSQAATSSGRMTLLRAVVGTAQFSHVTPIAPWYATGSLYNIDSISPYWLGSGMLGIGRPIPCDVCPETASPWTNLRSATRGDLVIPRTRPKLGKRSFRISAPTVWTALTPVFAWTFCYKPRTFPNENWKRSCSGKPTHQLLKTIEEWTHLLTYLPNWSCHILQNSQFKLHVNDKFSVRNMS